MEHINRSKRGFEFGKFAAHFLIVPLQGFAIEVHQMRVTSTPGGIFDIIRPSEPIVSQTVAPTRQQLPCYPGEKAPAWQAAAREVGRTAGLESPNDSVRGLPNAIPSKSTSSPLPEFFFFFFFFFGMAA